MTPERPELVGICWVDAETFWWDATNAPLCPVCSAGEAGYAEQHGYFVPQVEVERLSKYAADLEKRLGIPPFAALGTKGGAG